MNLLFALKTDLRAVLGRTGAVILFCQISNKSTMYKGEEKGLLSATESQH